MLPKAQALSQARQLLLVRIILKLLAAAQGLKVPAMISPSESEQVEKEQKWLWQWNRQRIEQQKARIVANVRVRGRLRAHGCEMHLDVPTAWGSTKQAGAGLGGGLVRKSDGSEDSRALRDRAS